MFCCSQIRKGQIFYGIQVISDPDMSFIPILEIYEFQGFNNDRDVEHNVILGDNGTIRFPEHFDLNQIFYGYYYDESVWAYSFNEQLMLDLLNRLIKCEIVPITEVYDIWNERWKNVFLLSSTNDN